MARIHTYSKGIKKFFSMYQEKFEVISFMTGMGGAMVYRILAHNKKYYWEDDFSCIESDQHRKLSLDWPDFDIGYKAHPNRRDPETLEQIEDNIPAQRLGAVHVNVLEFPSIQAFYYPDVNKEAMLRKFTVYFARMKKDQKILFRSHDMGVHNSWPNNRIIRIWGSSAMRDTYYDNGVFTHPISAPNVVNVNINKLLNPDYDVFLAEYLELCNNLNITPTIIPVRGYILNYNERLERLKNGSAQASAN